MTSTEMKNSKTEDMVSGRAILQEDHTEGTIPIDEIPIRSRQRCYQMANDVHPSAEPNSSIPIHRKTKAQKIRKQNQILVNDTENSPTILTQRQQKRLKKYTDVTTKETTTNVDNTLQNLRPRQRCFRMMVSMSQPSSASLEQQTYTSYGTSESPQKRSSRRHNKEVHSAIQTTCEE